MAQIDAEAFPRAASMLHVESVELPAVRILRGDASFAYPLRAGGSAAELSNGLRTELARGSAPVR